MLPYRLFANREVPQAFLGFSSFEYFFMRPVRGPLDLFEELWEEPQGEWKNVVQYVIQTRECLEYYMPERAKQKQIFHVNLLSED